jgi:hypothetical protein
MPEILTFIYIYISLKYFELQIKNNTALFNRLIYIQKTIYVRALNNKINET